MEREAEAKLVAQRDEFAKHERSLRERIVQLQNAVADSREKLKNVTSSRAGGDDVTAMGGAGAAAPAATSQREDSPGRAGSSRCGGTCRARA